MLKGVIPDYQESKSELEGEEVMAALLTEPKTGRDNEAMPSEATANQALSRNPAAAGFPRMR